MSAFILFPDHINYLVNAAVQYARDSGLRFDGCPVSYDNATEVGQRLLAENIASVSYRYSDWDPNDLPGPIPTPKPADFRHTLRLDIRPVQLLKAIACYEYQTCEHPGWQTSAAKAFCDDLRHAAIYHLPGYDAADWEITPSDTSQIVSIF